MDGKYTEVSILKAELEASRAETAAALDAQAAEAAEGLISLERARLQVIRYARINTEVYGPEYQETALVWEVTSAEEQEEFYYIAITYRPFGEFTGSPGREEFIMDKKGNIEFRQVLDPPKPEVAPPAESEGAE